MATAYAPTALSAGFLIPLFKVLAGVGVKKSAPQIGRIAASRIVTRTVVRGGVTTTVQTITTAELGITVAGITALSVGAAELLSKFDCKLLCVRDESDVATVVSESLSRPTHVTIDVFDVQTGRVEDYSREYVNPGNSQFKFKIPKTVNVGVKRLDGRADDDPKIQPFSSGNILLAGADDVFKG